MIKLNNDQVSTAVWFGLGALIAGGSVHYGLGTLANPGSGFITFLAALSMCVFSFIGLISATRKGGGWKPVMKGARWQKAFLVMGALLVYTLLLPRLGFIPCTVLFIGFMLRAVKPQGWAVVGAGSILTALASYAVFELWLQAQLPKGWFGF